MFRFFALIALCVCAAGAHAQQPVFGDGSTQPGKGRVTLRQTATAISFGTDSRTGNDAQQWTLNTNITAGITGRFSLSLDVPIISRDVEPNAVDELSTDFGDLTLLARYRVHQEDLGPVDTWRVMAIAGIEIPSFADGVSSDSFDPIVGVSSMLILGRHGLNASARWKFNTGDRPLAFSPGDNVDDALRYDASYAFRLSPERYKSDTEGALYLIGEMSGLYETNGDHELMLGPALLWEAKTYALEIGVQFPVEQDVDHRAERDLRFVLGFRLLF